MSGPDSAWLRMEHEENQMVITGIFRLKPAPDIDAFRELLKNRLLARYPRFRQRVINRDTIPVWEYNGEPDLTYHVKIVQLSDAADNDELQEWVSELMSRPLNFNLPLWEMYLVMQGERCTLVARLHHCIADGIALVRILLSLATVTPDGPYFEPHKEYIPRKRPLHEKKRGPLQLAGMVCRALMKFLFMPPDTPSELKGPLQTKKRAAWSSHIPLEDIKTLAEVHHATINDILLWLTCRAVRDYLTETSGLPSGDSDFRITMPVNLRGNDDTRLTGNHFGLIFLSLPVGLSDPEEQLRMIQQEMNYIKRSGESMVAFWVLGLLGRMPLFAESGIIHFLSSKCSAVVTNVPGPRRKLYLAGSKLSEMMFWVPKSGKVGLGISLISYNGRVRIGVVSDTGRMSHPQRLATLFYEQFTKEKKKALNLQN